jgi:anti-anti-sigma regulatory factor
MLKITRMDASGLATILRLEGRLTCTNLGGLEATIADCRRDDRRVVIDLVGLAFVDAPGAAALVAAQADDVELAGASAFVRDLLEEVRS